MCTFVSRRLLSRLVSSVRLVDLHILRSISSFPSCYWFSRGPPTSMCSLCSLLTILHIYFQNACLGSECVRFIYWYIRWDFTAYIRTYCHTHCLYSNAMNVWMYVYWLLYVCMCACILFVSYNIYRGVVGRGLRWMAFAYLFVWNHPFCMFYVHLGPGVHQLLS